MCKKYATYAILSALVLWSTSSAAQYLDNHFFLSFAGYKITGAVGADDFKENGLEGIFGYGRKLSDYATIEVSLYSYQEVKADIVNSLGVSSETRIRGSAVAILGVWSFLITDRWRVLAKAGPSHWKFIFKDEGGSEVSFDDTDMLYGFGFSFDADHDSTIRLEYEAYPDGPETKVLALGVQHNF